VPQPGSGDGCLNLDRGAGASTWVGGVGRVRNLGRVPPRSWDRERAHADGARSFPPPTGNAGTGKSVQAVMCRPWKTLNVRARGLIRNASAATGAFVILLGATACTEPHRVHATAGIGSTVVSVALAAAEVADASPMTRTMPAGAMPSPATSESERFLREEKERRKLELDDDQLRLCGEQTSATAGHLVALCNQGGWAHADSGWVDFYQLESRATAIQIKVERLKVSSTNGFGDPGEVDPIELGEDIPGFVLKGFHGNHGYFSETLVVVALRQGAWQEVARLEHLVDNEGSSDCDEHPGHCVRFEFAVQAEPAAGLNNLKATLVGTKGGRKVTLRYVLRFDAGRGVYPIPKALTPAE